MKKHLAISSVFALAACASVVSGTQQSVFLDTPQAPGASCKLNDSKKGVWYLPSTPGSVTVQKGDGPMTIVCEKQGYEITAYSVDEDLAGATFGNILIGGAIGLVVDAANGAAQRYPDSVSIWMKPVSFASADDERRWFQGKFASEDVHLKDRNGSKPLIVQLNPPTSVVLQPTGLPVTMAAPAPAVVPTAAMPMAPGASVQGVSLEAAMAAYDGRDFGTAFRLFHPLAEQGRAPAQYRLATMYLNGEGTSADPIEAMRWYAKADAQGYPGAKSGFAEATAQGMASRKAAAAVQAGVPAGSPPGTCYMTQKSRTRDTNC